MQALPAGRDAGGAARRIRVADAAGRDGVDRRDQRARAVCRVGAGRRRSTRSSRRSTARGVTSRRLHTSHAFHSAMMDPVLDAFRTEVARVERRAPQVPFVSNVTGTWITEAEATSPEYWVRHLRQAVRFADGVQTLLSEPARVFLEVGPGRTLASLVQQQRARRAPVQVVTTRAARRRGGCGSGRAAARAGTAVAVRCSGGLATIRCRRIAPSHPAADLSLRTPPLSGSSRRPSRSRRQRDRSDALN